MDIDLLRYKLAQKSESIPNGCRIWFGRLGFQNPQSDVPYGRIQHKKRQHYVQRLSFLVSHGYLPKKVSHLCHNSICINPDHLVEESQKINNQRKVCRGRIEGCTELHDPPCMLENDLGKYTHDLGLDLYRKLIKLVYESANHQFDY